MNRRNTIASAGALLLASTRRSSAQTPPTIRLGVYPTDSYAEPFFGQDAGIFKRAGLNVELTNIPTIMEAVVAGALDVGIGDVIHVANSVNAGFPIAIIAGGGMYTTDVPTTLLCASKNSTVRSAKDFEGQSIGVVQLASLSALTVREWLRVNGADQDRVRLLELPFATMNAALQKGQIQAAMMAEPFLSDARNDVRVVAKAFDAIAKSFYISIFMAKRDWVQQNSDVARRLTRALYETAQWANKNRDDSAPILAKYAKLDLDRVKAMNRSSFALTLDTRQMQPVLDIAYRYHEITKPVNAADLVVKL